jgi:TonB-linked SusC/RagA family outer membrane protein
MKREKTQKTQNQAIKHSFSRGCKVTLVLAVFLLTTCLHLFAASGNLPDINQQKQSVTGKVVDSSGVPLPGATVVIKGSETGIVTDNDGNYTLNQVPENATLIFSFVGMETQEVPVSGRTTINIAMAEESVGLEDLIVVGYGVQKKVNVVGSVSSIQGDEIKSVPAVSAAAAISGRLAGVTVLQTSGEPGTDAYMSPRIYVRGRTTLGDGAAKTNPLVIVDGVQGRNISEIDPNDIASFSVLKDASAAIYGAQAANGVILVTTKSGASGKPKLSFNFYQGFLTPSKTPEMANAAEYATMLSEFETYNGSSRTFSDEDIELFASGADPWEHPDTDWYGELIKKWTTATRYNLSIEGGSTKGTNYYISLGYKQDDAMYKQSSTKYDQINIRSKINVPITDWLNADVNIAGFKTKKLFPYRGAGDIIGNATRTQPTRPAYWPTGEPAPDIENGDNPVVTSSFAGGKNEQDTYRLQNFLKVTVTPPFIPGLSLSTSIDYDINNFYRKRFFQPWTLYYPDFNAATRDPNTGFVISAPLNPVQRQPTGTVLPRLTNDYNRTINTTEKIELNYLRSFGNHDITLFAGFEQYTNNYNEFSASRENYISTLIQILDVGPDLNKTNSGYETIYARKSWIGRATYAYKSKYLAEFLLRRDGSLKFPPKSRWGNFPGFLLGWRASEEDFWKDNLSFINYFKLKASYGEMGMDPGDPFQYMDKFKLGNIIGMTFGTGGEIETTAGPPAIANANITWETQITKNLGFESQFLNGLLFLNFDYFYNIRNNILAKRNGSVPDFTGLTLPDENMARVDNHGVEIEGGIRKSYTDWNFGVSGNLGYSRNKLVYIDEVDPPVPWQKKTGLPYGTRLMYQAIGIFSDENAVNSYPTLIGGARPGDIIFKNVSADYAHLNPDYDDNVINAHDQILLKHTVAPDLFYGTSFDLGWKSFSLSVLLQGQGTFYKKNFSDTRRGDEGNYFKFMYNDRWTPDNPNGSNPRPWNRDSPYWIPMENTFWWDNTAYLRLKNLMLSYNIPNKYYKSVGISNINVYFTGNNLAYLYSATDKFDPEVDGVNSYPTMKTFAFGANINF